MHGVIPISQQWPKKASHSRDRHDTLHRCRGDATGGLDVINDKRCEQGIERAAGCLGRRDRGGDRSHYPGLGFQLFSDLLVHDDAPAKSSAPYNLSENSSPGGYLDDLSNINSDFAVMRGYHL